VRRVWLGEITKIICHSIVILRASIEENERSVSVSAVGDAITSMADGGESERTSRTQPGLFSNLGFASSRGRHHVFEALDCAGVPCLTTDGHSPCF
jgi:hypothetical protein